MALRATITVVVALAVTGLGYLHIRRVERETALAAQLHSLTEAHKRAQERSESDRKALVARQARKASEARKLSQENQTLLNALRAHKPWSETDVPPDVREALLGRSDGPGGPSEPGGVRD